MVGVKIECVVDRKKHLSEKGTDQWLQPVHTVRIVAVWLRGINLHTADPSEVGYIAYEPSWEPRPPPQPK